MTQQVHSHPMVTPASSTTDTQNRTARAVAEADTVPFPLSFRDEKMASAGPREKGRVNVVAVTVGANSVAGEVTPTEQ